MIFGIPFFLGVGTFFIFMFGGVSAIVGTHGGKEQEPSGAEVIFLATHPKYRRIHRPSQATRPPQMIPVPKSSSDGATPVAALVPLRRVCDAETEA